jgi:hypothetical protein
MDAMIAEELYSTLYNGKDKTVHGTVISESREKRPDSTPTDVEGSHEKKDFTRQRRDAMYMDNK